MSLAHCIIRDTSAPNFVSLQLKNSGVFRVHVIDFIQKCRQFIKLYLSWFAESTLAGLLFTNDSQDLFHISIVSVIIISSLTSSSKWELEKDILLDTRWSMGFNGSSRFARFERWSWDMELVVRNITFVFHIIIIRQI